MLLAYEATDQIRVEPTEIETPVQATTGVTAVEAAAPRSSRSSGRASACSTA
jgi:uracil phosphoribosyltransferase